jgi:hypothetical protein
VIGVRERRRSYSDATHKCLHGARQTGKLRDGTMTTRMPQGCGALDSSQIRRWKRTLGDSEITQLASLLEVLVHRGAGPAKWLLMATGASSYKTNSRASLRGREEAAVGEWSEICVQGAKRDHLAL